MNTPEFFSIQSLTRDPDLQVRVQINDEQVAQYAECMATEEAMKAFVPVEIFHDGKKYWLGDGHHRVGGAEKAGHDKVWAIVKNGTWADALWSAICGNGKQGFGLTRADRQRTIKLAITQWPDRSNGALAEAIGCGEATIRRYRDQLTTSSNDEVETMRRTGKDGKSRPVKQRVKKQVSEKPDESATVESADLDQRTPAPIEPVNPTKDETTDNTSTAQEPLGDNSGSDVDDGDQDMVPSADGSTPQNVFFLLSSNGLQNMEDDDFAMEFRDWVRDLPIDDERRLELFPKLIRKLMEGFKERKYRIQLKEWLAEYVAPCAD